MAFEGDWGAGTGAASIPGSPYHVALALIDTGSIGKRDNQMQASAVVPPPPGTVNVRKFEDENANGTKDGAGEPGIAGWRVYVFQNEAGYPQVDGDETTLGVDPFLTGTDGTLTISLIPGSYLICESAQNGGSGWTQSFPTTTSCADAIVDGDTLAAKGHLVTVVSDDTHPETGFFDFGNWRTATKSGMKFEDLNADGVKDDGEPGVGGVTIKAFRDDDGDGVKDAGEIGTPDYTATTAETTGAYSMSMTPGKYWVCEVVAGSWTQSFPSGTTCSGITGVGAGGYYIDLDSNETDSGNDFGNWRTSDEVGDEVRGPER